MTTDREVSQVVLNKLTKAQYDAIETKNPNEFYAITDADLVGWGIPDYSSSIAISSGYVAPSNGYVYIVRGGGSSFVTLYVNGVAVDSNYSNTSNEGGGLSAFVAKGSTITWDTGNISSSVFFPCIGG